MILGGLLNSRNLLGVCLVLFPNLFRKFGGLANSAIFKIPNNGSWAKKDGARRYHLKTKHTNASGDVPSDPRGGFNQVPGVLASRDAVKRRWARKLEEFRKVLWPGAHDIETDPAVVKVSVNKTSGKTYQTPGIDVDNMVTPSLLVKSPLQFVRRILAKFLLFKNGNNCGSNVMTLQLRRKRIVVAVAGLVKLRLPKELRSPHTEKLPCPKRAQVPPVLSVVFVVKELEKRLTRAHETSSCGRLTADHRENMLTLSLTKQQAKTCSWLHSRKPTFLTRLSQVLHILVIMQDGRSSFVHLTVTNLLTGGGVALAVRRPFSLKKLHAESSPEGQTLSAVLHGAQRTINVVTHYRHHTDQTLNGIQQLVSNLQICREPSWIVACDANANVVQGPIPEYFKSIGGVNPAIARHVKSTFPIDAVFASADLTRSENAGVELPALGSDHTRAQAKIGVVIPKCGIPLRRFAKPRPVISKDPTKVPWQTVSSPPEIWKKQLLNPEEAWQAWAQAVETWLVRAGILDPRRGEKTLGEVPSLRMALGSSSLSRNVNFVASTVKLRKLGSCTCKVDPFPDSCTRKFVLPPSCQVIVGTWGKISGILSNKLHDLQETEKSRRLSDWKDKIHSLAGACKWVQKAEVTPMVLKHDDVICVSPGKVLDALKNHLV